MPDNTAQQNPTAQNTEDTGKQESSVRGGQAGQSPKKESVSTTGTTTQQPNIPNKGKSYQNDVKNEKLIKIAGVVVALIFVLALVYHFESTVPPPVTTSTTSVATSFNINSCTSMSLPGTYYITSDIASAGPSTCMNIESNNVKIIGGGHSIIGNGPFTLSGTRSYGISVNSKTGISVSNLTIAKFSYGIFFNSSNGNQVNNVTVLNSTISGIYLYNASNNKFNGDILKSTVTDGGLNISLGQNNTLSKSSVEYNLNTGISFSNTINNKIIGSALLGNPTDLVCYGNSVFSTSNKFQKSTCFENSMCNFAYCSGQNNQSDIRKVILTKQINSCGSINQAGAYSLSKDLNLSDYMNTSLAGGSGFPCILINSSNVYLTCGGHSIINAHYGIFADKGTFNDTITGCALKNDTYGIYLGNLIKFALNGIDAFNNHYGAYIFASDDGNITNITASRNRYGTYVNGTTYATFSNFQFSNNTYGIFIDNSTDVYFNNGKSLSNSKTDLYCTASIYNSTLLSLQGSECGSSDCGWAPNCPIRSLPALAVYPINGCTSVDVPGSYAVQGTILDQKSGTCFDIDSNNVSITCNNSTIYSVNKEGTAFNMQNVTNVTISNCAVNNFLDGFVAENTTKLTINTSSVMKSVEAFNISSSSDLLLFEDNASHFSNYGFSLVNTTHSGLYNNHADSGIDGYGFFMQDSFNNTVMNNTASYSGYGIYLDNSRNNLIYNNSMENTAKYDYYCGPNSGGILDQYGRLNYGVSKFDCIWMVSIPFATAQNPCSYRNTPDTVTLSTDMLYTFGATCFSFYSSTNTSATGSVVDCNGHTVLATNGGSFMSAYNIGATIKNCVLIGFTNPIVFNSSTPVSGISIINDTIINNKGTAIIVNRAKSSKILYNNITNSTNGIWVNVLNSSSISYNKIDRAGIGIYVNGSASTLVMNNTISNSANSLSIQNSQSMTSSGNKIGP